MSFVTGEVEAREQAPWAYDATNDVLKTGPFHLAASGLGKSIQYSINPFPHGGAGTSTIAVGGAFYLVPAGKIILLTDLTVSTLTGKVQCKLEFDGNGTGVAVVTPATGGSDHKSFRTPVKFVAGQKIHFSLYSADATDPGDLNCRAQFIEL